MDGVTASNESIGRGRRAFLGMAALAAAAAVVPSEVAGAFSPTSRAFEIDSHPDVCVRVTQGRFFTLTVVDRDGSELELHRVSVYSLRTVNSPYFTVRSITAPQAA